MRKQVMFLVTVFVLGCIASLALVMCVLSVRTSSIDVALSMLKKSNYAYAVVVGSSGVAWIFLSIIWIRVLGEWSKVTFCLVFLVNSATIGPLGQAISALFNSFADDAPFDPDVLNPLTYWSSVGGDGVLTALNIVRGLALTLMIRSMKRNNHWTHAAAAAAARPAVIHDGPEQVTRILCGYALLGDAAFRHRVAAFFRNRWIAVAPEYGLDVQLLCSVCDFSIHRHRLYAFGYFVLFVVCVIVSPFSSECALALLVLAGAGIHLVKKQGDFNLSRDFRRSTFDPTAMAAKYAAWQSDVVRCSLPPSDQNVVVYRGFSPFVGAGLDLDGWSIVTRIDKPNPEGGGSGKVDSFDETEIYRALDAGLCQMDLKNFSCKDILFVRGIDVREDAILLSDVAYPPIACLPQEQFNRYFLENKGTIRSYKRIQFVGWGGDIVITMFARFSIEGQNLVLELRKFLLAPLSNELRVIDRHEPVSLRVFMLRLLASTLVGPFSTIFSPLTIWEAIHAGLGVVFESEEGIAKARRKHVEDDPFFDHGAGATLRESFSQSHFAHYFQKADFDSISKLIERRIFNVVEDFLEEHSIDASDFRERQASILNSGIIVQGGDVRAETLAVGLGARASTVENRRQTTVKEGA